MDYPLHLVPIFLELARTLNISRAAEKLEMYAVLPIRSVESALKEGRIRVASRNELRNDVYLVLPDHEFQEKRYLEVVRFLLRRGRELEQALPTPQKNRPTQCPTPK